MSIDNLTEIRPKRMRDLHVEQFLRDPSPHGQFDRVPFDLSGSLCRIDVLRLTAPCLLHRDGSPLSADEPVLLIPGIERLGVHAAANRLWFVASRGLRGLDGIGRLKPAETTLERLFREVPRH